MRTILTGIIALVLACNALAEPSLTGTAGELSTYLSAVPQTVVVTGRAELKVAADRAVIHLKVTTEEKSLKAALKKNQAIRTEITTTLVQGGIAADRIKGSRFSSTPSHGLWSDKVKSYRVENALTISVSNEDEFQLVAAEIEKHPELTYQGIHFERSDQPELKRKAIAQACEAAVAKKQLFEEKLSVQLTTVGFSEAFAGSTTPMDQVGRSVRGGAVSNYAQVIAGVSVEASDEAVSQFDEITYVAQVTLECRLVQAQDRAK